MEAVAVSAIACTGLLPLARFVSENTAGFDPSALLTHISTNGNIVLHLTNALLIYIIGKVMLKRLRNYDSIDNIKYALIAPILFNLHPIHTAAFNGSISPMPYLSLCVALITCLLYFGESRGLSSNIMCLVSGSVFLYISNTFTWQGAILVLAYNQSKSLTFVSAMVFISYFYFTRMRDYFSFDYIENLNKILSSTTLKCSISRLSMAVASSLYEFLAISGTGNGSCAAGSIDTVIIAILLLVMAFCGVSKVEVNGSPWQVVSCGLIALFFINYTYIIAQLMDDSSDNIDEMTTRRYISLSIVCTIIGFVITDVKRGLYASTVGSADSNALVYKISPFVTWAFHIGVECVLLAMATVTLKALLMTAPSYGDYLPQYIVKFVNS